MSAPSKENQEALSCLMDGELSESETRFLLRRLEHESDLQARWSRWHAARSGLGLGEVSGGCRRDLTSFAASVAAAIESEPAPELAAGSSRPPLIGRILKPVAGLGVAAAVAAIAINLTPGDGPESLPTALVDTELAATAPVTDASIGFGVGNSARSVSSGVTRGLDPRLQEYLIRHNEVSSSRRGQGLVPYVYVLTPTTRSPQPDTQAEAKVQPAAGAEPAEARPAAEQQQ